MENADVEQIPKTSRKNVGEWLATHKAAKRLIHLGIVFVFLVLMFLGLRQWAIYRMDHYATYAINQMGFSQNSSGRTPVSGVDGNVQKVAISNKVAIDGCEQRVILTCSYTWFTVLSGGYRKDFTDNLDAYYLRFKTKDKAQTYLSEQNKSQERNRYVLGNYYFDFPRELSIETLDPESNRKEAYNQAVSDLYSSDLLLTLLLYRSLVAFDFSTGLEGSFI